jgi:hypothetical protein
MLSKLHNITGTDTLHNVAISYSYLCFYTNPATWDPLQLSVSINVWRLLLIPSLTILQSASVKWSSYYSHESATTDAVLTICGNSWLTVTVYRRLSDVWSTVPVQMPRTSFLFMKSSQVTEVHRIFPVGLNGTKYCAWEIKLQSEMCYE